MSRVSPVPARRSCARDTFQSLEHGDIEVPNPYDWLEDTTSQETRDFVDAQNAAFSHYLDDHGLIESKQRLIKTLSSMWGLTATPNLPHAVGDDYIFRVMGRGREFPVSYRIPKAAVSAAHASDAGSALLSSNPDPDSDVFYDEATYSGMLMAASPSRSGRYWAFTSSHQGSDWGVIRIKDVRSGEILKDEVHGTKFTSKPSSHVPWLGDRGFFYPYYPGGPEKPGSPQLRFHEVGRMQEEDEVVYEDASKPAQTYKAAVSSDDRFVFLEIYLQGRGCQVWAATVSQDAAEDVVNGHDRKLLLKFNGKVSEDFDVEWEYIGSVSDPSGFVPADKAHLFWTSADNGKIVSYKPGDDTLKEVVGPHGQQTLKLARLLPGGNILAIRSIDVRDQVQLFSRTGSHLRTLDVPVWTIVDVSHDPSTDQVFVLESSFCYPPRVWHAQLTRSRGSGPDHGDDAEQDDDGLEFSPFTPIELFPADTTTTTTPGTPQRPLIPKLSTKQVFYPSADGTKIPMFITSAASLPDTDTDTDAQPNSNADTPILLYVYGGFGVSVIPHFRPEFATFSSSFHGAVAIANVRGGGEYGRPWHQAACKERRQALFDDIVGAAAYLRDVRGARTVLLMGESMGALNCAVAMVQRPELFSGVLLNAGPLDVLHRRRLGLGDRGVLDIGDVHVPAEFDFVYRWTPLEKADRQGQGQGQDQEQVAPRYPPVLLVAGDKDDFVKYTHSCKMAAVLQHAARGVGDASVTSLKIVRNLGHAGNISAKEKTAVNLERWLWVKKALGLEIYPV